MVVKNGKSATKRKITNSSARSNRSHSVSKGSSNRDFAATIDKLDGTINHDESTAVQGEAGSAILEKAGNDCGAPGLDLSSGSLELTAITLHQPWASLIAAGKKQYETRSWATDYRGPIAIHAGKKFEQDRSLLKMLETKVVDIPLGAIVAVAELTDCILMSEEFINQQSLTELYLGLWQIGRYAWKLENVRAIEPIPATGKQGLWKWNQAAAGFDSLEIYPLAVNSQQSTVSSQQPEAWNPADFGELHHVAEADGQLNLLDWTDREPPEPDDYSSIELFDAAYKQWCDAQTNQAEEELVNFGEDELCKQLMDGSICAAELVQDSKNLLSGIINTSEEVMSNGESNLSELRSGVHIVQPESEILQQGMQISGRKSKHQFGGSDRPVRVGNDSSRSSESLWSQAENNLEIVQSSRLQISNTSEQEEHQKRESKSGIQWELEGGNNNEKRLHSGEMSQSSQSKGAGGLCSAAHSSNGEVSGEIFGMVRSEQSEQRSSSSHQSQQTGQQDRESSIDEGVRTSERASDFSKEGGQKKGYGGNIPVSSGSCFGNKERQECGGNSNQEGNKSSGNLLGVRIDSSNTIENQQELSGGTSKCEFLQDAAGSEQDLSLQASSLEDLNSANSLNGTVTVNQSSSLDIPKCQSTETSEALKESQGSMTSAAFLPPANPSQLMENDALPTTIATVSPTYSEQFEICNQDSPSSKTLLDCSTAPIPPVTNQEVTLDLSSTPYRQVGTMRNGSVSGVMNLPLPGVGKGYLLLRSPGALSHSGKASPPGKTRLENQLLELGLISTQEVAAPEFLETGYQLPIGWTNLEENRTANELVQALQQPIDPKSELPAVTETTAIDVQPSETLSIGELQQLDCAELSISLTLPSNIGALTKNELIFAAQEQHQLICVIERKEFKLALEKLHRVRLTGIYLQEFKKKCGYGEFENQLEQAGIGVRSAQNYMTIAKNWDIVEAKTKLVALLAEENQPAIGLKWAIEAVRDEKKQLKSAAPPKDPDSWRTPNTKEQPIVDLVKQALGGLIWLDPCSGAVSNNIPCSVRYYKENDGLSPHQGWSKTVYINPPFSDPLPWVERCCLEFARGSVSAAVMLLKAGTLSNVGTGELINKYASAVCHWRGRINFLNDEGNAVKGSDFDCVLIYFGARLDLFRKAFGGRGTISTIDNHYSSVNKKFTAESEPDSVREEERQIAAAMGLSNGKSLLPDRRDDDREMMERYDPHTVSHEFMPSQVLPKINPEIEADCDDKFDQAKRSCLNDYITAISSNISDFSDEQLAFLAKIINEESAKRIDF